MIRRITVADIQKDNPLKCVENGCWHKKAKGYIVCICCLHGRCYTILEEDRILTVSVEGGN